MNTSEKRLAEVLHFLRATRANVPIPVDAIDAPSIERITEFIVGEHGRLFHVVAAIKTSRASAEQLRVIIPMVAELCSKGQTVSDAVRASLVTVAKANRARRRCQQTGLPIVSA